MIRLLSFLTALLITPSILFADEAQDLKTIEDLLKSGQGVKGSLHAVVPEHNVYVFAYFGSSFFEQVRVSLAPRDAAVLDSLKKLKRHDQVRVFGTLSLNNQQPHIRLTDIQLIKAWDSPLSPYSHEVNLPKDLEGQKSFIGKVHAVHSGGAVVVLEYKDTVLPLIVSKSQWPFTKDLFRGDKVRVYFRIADYPTSPTHLELSDKAVVPVEVLDNVRYEHEKIYEFEGALVMFPASPQIKFNVFALQRDMGDGVVRDYTLIPKSFDPGLFQLLRDKLQATWDASSEVPVHDRNKWLKKTIRIKAKGSINVIDPNQANPQIFLEDLKDVQVL